MVKWASPCLSFFFSASTVAAYTFTRPTSKTTIISLEPCALNADFQHFIHRFNEIFLLYGYPQRRVCDVRRPKDRVTLQVILVFTFTCPKTFTQGRVHVFDKYLQCWYWTIHSFQLIHLHNMENYVCVRIVYFIPLQTYIQTYSFTWKPMYMLVNIYNAWAILFFPSNFFLLL